VKWDGLDALPVLASNQALMQIDAVGATADSVLLTFGHASPPPIIGTPEEQASQMAEISEVAVRPLVRLSMSPRRLRELVSLLNRSLEQLEGSGGEQ
jgi:hypothetical protein